MRSPGAAGRSIIGRPAVTAFVARAAAIAMLLPAAAAAAVPAAATDAATTTDPGGGMLSPGATSSDPGAGGSASEPAAPAPDAGSPPAPAPADASPTPDPTPSAGERSATGAPEPAGASGQSPAGSGEQPQYGADGALSAAAGTEQGLSKEPSHTERQPTSASVQGHAAPSSVPMASAQNVSVIYQAVWQVQKGCQTYCYGTSQAQSASQSSTTQQSATATGGGSTPSGAEAVNAAGTVQFIFQTQLGCIAFCFTTSQVQSASQSAQTTQVATATSDAVLTAINVAETFQFIWQVQQGCEVECHDTSATQSQSQQQANQSAATPERPFDGPQTFLAWIAVIAANNAATVQSIYQYDEASCLERCTGDAQVQDAVLAAATTQQATAAVGDHEAIHEQPGAPFPTGAGSSSDAPGLTPAATTASATPSASASASAPPSSAQARATAADRPTVGVRGTAMIAAVGASPPREPSSRRARGRPPAARAHTPELPARDTSDTQRPARAHRAVLGAAAASRLSPASSRVRGARSVSSLPTLRSGPLTQAQTGSHGPGVIWLAAVAGLLVALVSARTVARRVHRFCTGFTP